MLRYLSILLLLCPFILAAQTPPEYEKLIHELVETEGPGAAWLVAKEGKVIARGARGMADVARKEPLTPEHVFRIGSITKQFTAVAILQLVEQGALKLNDDLTRFIPDYPVNEGMITVEHLLNHTSGIKSYTSMPEFDEETQQKRVSPREIMDLFKDQPHDFEPGSQWSYNNSGYVLLGLIIERVSGMPYQDYVEKQIFSRLNMRNSHYGRDDVQVPGHATGHAKGPEGWAEAMPLSMTWPYSAGSLLSTVDDLHAWNTAVMSGKVVKKELLQMAHTPTTLITGRTFPYGYGWSLAQVQGSPTIEHGGGINGFVCNGIFLPEEDMYVIVLTNQETDMADDLAARLAAVALGRPYEFEEIALNEEELRQFEGVYEDENGVLRYVRLDGGGLVSQRAGRGKIKLKPDARDHFYFEGSLTQMSIRRNEKGEVIGLTVHDRTFGDTEWTRSDKALPAEEAAMELTEEQLKPLTGEYELMPGFNLTVTSTGTQLMAQATGQQAFELFPTSPTSFFLKVVDARVEFHPDEAGKVDRLVLFQGGQEIEGKRMQ
jgi:CubicO group peptidase (beta-lactamase class C family)